MSTDRISDLLTRIRNAQRAGHPTVTVPASKTKEKILSVLIDAGYVERVEPVTEASGKKASLKIYLRYSLDGRPAIQEVTRLSKPGRRVYVGSKDIPWNRSGLGLVVVSTSQGMMAGERARKENLGGELICSVF